LKHLLIEKSAVRSPQSAVKAVKRTTVRPRFVRVIRMP
jgi:hypothetical protein